MDEKIVKVELNKNENERLDTYVASLSAIITSRSMAQKLIKDGKITVNGKVQKESYKVKENDEIRIIIEEPKQTDLKAEEIPLDIVYEDDYIVVVNKPKGIVVHPGNGNPDGTLVNAILNHCKG